MNGPVAVCSRATLSVISNARFCVLNIFRRDQDSDAKQMGKMRNDLDILTQNQYACGKLVRREHTQR
ncbi:hypothetical protein DPMN_106567 [Dreissena polymorpha]|uniref:Uncharacterized protein n=1 Tax=Dreissena polymorpha TaxID=45954 RepID=A0A9D4K5F3_DREPO|nr:hypothetical protein DPMN_106567 [Dreissena polymorpha]